ncbi:MAG: nucleotide pyrophosphohydrolase [Desulfobulbaceae bacterium]|jgi:uncharacterized protein YabN with tetrapyrrole methylase and pyrophosphatase domain|nr:nucleotide pyrophosphohydrolase [Desulfobulbaceae bacterium]
MTSTESSQDFPASDAFSRLQQIIVTLRGADGCPWDGKQTPISLKNYLVEECQELIEAIDKDRGEDVCEEIGDVFFILTMLITIYTEQQRFTVDDVFAQIVAKMIRRHPHVFAGAPVGNEQELRAQWERIKELEKRSSPTSPR